MRVELRLVGGNSKARSESVSREDCINLMPTVVGGTPALVCTEGLKLLHDVPVRGMLAYNNVGYLVSGNKFYKFDLENITELGTIDSSEGFVSLSNNLQEILIVDGVNNYVFNIATEALVAPMNEVFTQAVFHDGYFVGIEKDTQKFYISGSYDGLTWNALDFASAESQPDKAVSIISDHGELWVLGENSGDIYYNSGNADFPFDRASRLETGCAAAFSVAKLDNSVFWLGDDGVVYRAQGYQPTRLSDDTVEISLSGLRGEWKDAIAFTFTNEGKKFYCLRLPSVCHVFDLATGIWHVRSSRKDKVFGGTWLATHYVYLNNKHIIGGDKTYLMSRDYLDEAGELIQRVRVIPPSNNLHKRVFFSSFELNVQAGVGLDGIQQGDDPTIRLSWANDNGLNFGNFLEMKVGRIGRFKDRALRHKLGMGRERRFKLEMTDPVNWVLLNAYVEAESE